MASKAAVNRRIAKGFCCDCGKVRDGGARRCRRCTEKATIRNRALRGKRRATGQCTRCSGVPEAGAFCLICFLKNSSERWFGTSKYWSELKEKLEKQKRICPYSGRLLIPGINAWLDHIIPRSQDGVADIANVQWVDKQINLMKANMSHTEFIAMCSLVSSRFPLMVGVVDAKTVLPDCG